MGHASHYHMVFDMICSRAWGRPFWAKPNFGKCFSCLAHRQPESPWYWELNECVAVSRNIKIYSRGVEGVVPSLWFMGSGNVGSSPTIILMVLCSRAAERLLGSYLYPARHLFFAHLLPLSTSTIS
jgi:hypothetical protein